jgi:hypothetical protein
MSNIGKFIWGVDGIYDSPLFNTKEECIKDIYSKLSSIPNKYIYIGNILEEFDFTELTNELVEKIRKESFSYSPNYSTTVNFEKNLKEFLKANISIRPYKIGYLERLSSTELKIEALYNSEIKIPNDRDKAILNILRPFAYQNRQEIVVPLQKVFDALCGL